MAPSLGYWVPGLGQSKTSDWNVEGAHLAERCSLFIIIALGESVLVTGASFAELEWRSTTLLAFAIAFLGNVAMWWIYFHIGAERGSDHISHSDDPGRSARMVYTYVHGIIVAGIIVSAVGYELLLMHPTEALDLSHMLAIILGPFLFLLGSLPFKWFSAGQSRAPLSHLIGLGLMTLIGVLSIVALNRFEITALMLTAAMSVSLTIVAFWETISLGLKNKSKQKG